jgi:hypothetical protein
VQQGDRSGLSLRPFAERCGIGREAVDCCSCCWWCQAGWSGGALTSLAAKQHLPLALSEIWVRSTTLPEVTVIVAAPAMVQRGTGQRKLVQCHPADTCRRFRAAASL